jgi:hypothetical protein
MDLTYYCLKSVIDLQFPTRRPLYTNHLFAKLFCYVPQVNFISCNSLMGPHRDDAACSWAYQNEALAGLISSETLK